MKDWKFNGRGKLTYTNGSYYNGDWIYGMQHGFGVFK